MTARSRLVLAAGLAVAAVAMAAVAAQGTSLDGWLMALATRIEVLGGPAGFVLFVALFVAGALLLIPTSALSLVAGLIYGPAGIAAAWLSMMFAAAFAFPLARYAFLDAVEALVRSRPVLRTLAEVAADEGWRMVLLVRVSGFVPFGLQNYALGVTRVPFRPYLLATSLGVLPSILVYASVGALGQATLRGGQIGAPQIALLTLGAAASATLVVMAARKVRARLRARPV